MGVCMNNQINTSNETYLFNIEDKSLTKNKNILDYSKNTYYKKSSTSIYSNETNFISSCSNHTSFINTETSKETNSLIIPVITPEKNSPILTHLKLRNKKNISPLFCVRN